VQFEKLEALREARKKQLLGYLASIEEELVAAAANPFTLDALRAYDAGWEALGLGQKETLLSPIEGAGRQIAHDDISAIGACGLYQHALAQTRARQFGTL